MEEQQRFQIAGRLKDFILYKKIKQNALAQSLGVTTGFVNNLVKGRTDVTKKTLSELGKNFPDLSIDWLLYGRGTMLITDQAAPVAQETSPVYEAREGVFGAAERVLDSVGERLEALEDELSVVRVRLAAIEGLLGKKDL